MGFRRDGLGLLWLCWAMGSTAVAAEAGLPGYGVLSYHEVVDESGVRKPRTVPSEPNDGMVYRQYYPQTISAETLVRHFNWLKANGYTPVSWQQLVDARAGKIRLPEKPVLLTFDDGYENFYRLVFPLLKAYRYPAMLSIVTSWLEAAPTQTIPYSKRLNLPRAAFVSWAQVKEMQSSGLVEIASHSHDLHKSVTANPRGSQQAAVIAPVYRNGRYETPSEYRQRLRHDFATSVRLIERHTGQRPRVMVWPYGQFNETARAIAREVGMADSHSLNDNRLNHQADTEVVGRLLIQEETQLNTVSEYLSGVLSVPSVQRVVHVDLDAVYDPDPQQLSRNVDALIERISQYGITTVYLQAFADQNGDGVAEALYFPNRHMPVKADLFGRVAWQLMTRSQVAVYAWMPVLSFDLGKKHHYVTDVRTGKPATEHYLRLSPYDATNQRVIAEIYTDLAFHTQFNGVLFHDDAFLTDFEGVAGSQPVLGQKEDGLIALTHRLRAAMLPYAFQGDKELKTARNLYARVVLEPEATAWFAQSLPKFTKSYDYTAIMAMPYMENEQAITPQQAQKWLIGLAEQSVRQAPAEKLVFELQAKNWRTGRPISVQEMRHWMVALQRVGIQNMGYYPDDFIRNHPDMRILGASFSVKRPCSGC